MPVFVPGKPFQLSLMFVGKARSLTFSGARERCFTQEGWIQPYSQTLGQVCKACKGQTL